MRDQRGPGPVENNLLLLRLQLRLRSCRESALAMLVLLLVVCGVLPAVSGWTTPEPDWRPCGDFPWDTDDVTVDCDYTYSYSRYYRGRCTVRCPAEAEMLVGPPYSDSGPRDGAYYCLAGNNTWLGSEPVCLGRFDNLTVITDDTNGIRLVGGEFYGCVELYDDVTQQWGPVRGWDVWQWDSHYDARMAWADLACRNLGFRKGLATHSFPLTNGVVSDSWVYPIRESYYPSYPSTVPEFLLSGSLPQGEGATLHDAIDRVDRGSGHNRDNMCLACAGKRDERSTPCGDFPHAWDTDDVTVDCDYTYREERQKAGRSWWTTESPWYVPWWTTKDPWYAPAEGPTEPPSALQGRCTVNCTGDADMLVGPLISDEYSARDGAYYCHVANRTWTGTEPVCLGEYNSSIVITDDTNTIRLVGGEFYGCVELFDDVTRQWGPVLGWGVNWEWQTHYANKMAWADLACKNLGFREGLATAAYPLRNGVVSGSTPSSLQYRYRYKQPYSYNHNGPYFMLSESLPQWEGAILHDAIERVERGDCDSWNGWNYYTCPYVSDNSMCLACAGKRKKGISAHVTCTSDHLEASFPRPADNSVQPADIQLAAPPCRAEGNSTHIYIRAPLGGCGTSSETTASEIIYRNTLAIGADTSNGGNSSHGGITWYRVPKILLECRLPRKKMLSFDFKPHLMSVFRSDVQGQGDFEISMELFRTDGFRNPVTEYPVLMELRQMLHVQIQVNSSDADLQVFAHTCVATPSDDPDDKAQNDVIINGCPKLPTLQFYPSPGPDRGRFGFQAFAYTSGAPTVYLHCDVLLCKASDPNSRCAQGCLPPSGRRRREAEGEPEVYRLIQGPIVLGKDQTDLQARVPTPTSSRHDLVTASSVLGACAVLAAAMFVVGLLYKARREGDQAGYRVLENVE
ncbi:uncharacterized protein [Branchiostoma lanceolatum]|uniref:uncharacterized protein n=1 Tax=Branchiostoma lanceolatum TaxID=7740 RepID=UPI00345639BA